MKTTGYALREALRQHELRRDTAARAFNGSLKAFPDEKKEDPREVIKQFMAAERALAKLEMAQTRYNLAVTLEVHGEKMTLLEVIKRIAGEARVEKMWRSAAGPTERYGYENDVRDPNQVRAVPTMATQEITKLASVSAKRTGAFRQAIAVGNAREIELEDLDPALFE